MNSVAMKFFLEQVNFFGVFTFETFLFQTPLFQIGYFFIYKKKRVGGVGGGLPDPLRGGGLAEWLPSGKVFPLLSVRIFLLSTKSFRTPKSTSKKRVL